MTSDYLLHLIDWVESDQFTGMAELIYFLLLQTETLVVIFELALYALKTVTVFYLSLA